MDLIISWHTIGLFSHSVGQVKGFGRMDLALGIVSMLLIFAATALIVISFIWLKIVGFMRLAGKPASRTPCYIMCLAGVGCMLLAFLVGTIRETVADPTQKTVIRGEP